MQVQWLVQNFVVAEGVSIQRSAAYQVYVGYCKKSQLEPVNAAEFGKLLHSVFVGLRVR
jgi:hypothetical protein